MGKLAKSVVIAFNTLFAACLFALAWALITDHHYMASALFFNAALAWCAMLCRARL